MVAIAIFSTDPAMRRSLEQLLREDSALSIIGVVDDPTAISLLIDQNHVNVVLADVPPLERLADWRIRPALLSGASLVGELLDDKDPDRVRLTPRELEVLAAMADGVSNKAIAARLGISFHTAKFHVAAILAKLNADSRTEAVARAAQLGLVML